MSRKLFYILFAVVALYALALQQFFKNEAQYILKTPQTQESNTNLYSASFQKVNLPINKTTNLYGMWFRQASPKGMMVVFPPAGFLPENIRIKDNIFYKLGFDVLFTTYRGTSLSTGKAESENDLINDAQQWYRFANSQFSEDSIVVVGQGLGASIATKLSDEETLHLLILENPRYDYGRYLARKKFWWMPYSTLSNFPLKTWDYLQKTSSPIILLQNETQKINDNNLLKFLKSSDKIAWINKSETAPYSNNPSSKTLFKRLLQSYTPSSDSLLKTK